MKMARLLIKTSVIIFENVGKIIFTSCLGNPDVWIRPAMSKDDKEYYGYVLLWTDDCLDVSHRLEVVLQEEIGE